MKNFKIVGLTLVITFLCVLPAAAFAKGPKFSFSLNIDAFPFLTPPPSPPPQVVEQYVYVQPLYPYPYPPCYQEKAIVQHYYYPSYPTPRLPSPYFP